MQKVKKLTRFSIKVRSRHPSHAVLRQELPYLPFRSIVRLGSTTSLPDDIGKIFCNSPEGVRNSSNKFLMKKCFEEAHVTHASWFVHHHNSFYQVSSGLNENEIAINSAKMEFPIVAKHIYGSRGKGNTLINSLAEFKQWFTGKEMKNYIFEKFYSYTREYRLHITAEGCFYTCRKLIKQEFKDKPNAWQRHDDNCVWILENNPSFDKPTCWNKIVEDCVKALKYLKLDVAAFDVKVQSAKDKKGIKRNEVKYILF